jgi:hypothetical protein
MMARSKIIEALEFNKVFKIAVKKRIESEALQGTLVIIKAL